MSAFSDSHAGVGAASGGRVVLITGAAGRVGRACALGFAARGWDVAVHYSASHAEADAIVAQIRALGRRACALHADLAVEADTAQLVPACTAALGRPHCVVNQASLIAEDTAYEVGYDTLLHSMSINLAAPLVLARALYQATPEGARDDESQRAVVVNMLAQKLYNPSPDHLSYTLSKAALQTATIALAQALAPKVRVVGLASGLTLQSADGTPDDVAARPEASRLEDVVAAACYLADARSVTGTTLIVDGGRHLVPLS